MGYHEQFSNTERLITSASQPDQRRR